MAVGAAVAHQPISDSEIVLCERVHRTARAKVDFTASRQYDANANANTRHAPIEICVCSQIVKSFPQIIIILSLIFFLIFVPKSSSTLAH